MASLQADANPRLSNIQVANVNYLRPETWSFFFGVELMGVSGAPAADVDFTIKFDLIVGVGRDNFDTLIDDSLPRNAFATFLMRVPAGVVPPNPAFQYKRWTTQTLSPPTDDSVGATSRLPLTWFPAQDIRCRASLYQVTGGANIGADFRLSAFFAPRSHMRPDWFVEKFSGEELGGR